MNSYRNEAHFCEALGGVVAKVAAVEHMGSGGSNFSFNFGQCEAPQD